MTMKFGTFWQTLVRKTAPVTSVEAAASLDSASMEQRVYEVIATFENGCIQDEVLDQLSQYPYSSVTARFRTLLNRGYIIDTGLTRPGKSGRQQRVLKIKEAV
jgi:hypothetical protein